MQKPQIPMSPADLPQQRVALVVDLPLRPQPFDSVVGYDVKPAGLKFKKGPLSATYLGQLEWAWSPENNQLSAYYIHRSRKHWILWTRYIDENSWSQRWVWMPIGFVPRDQANQIEAAIQLMIDFLTIDRENSQLARFHWVAGTGLLSVSQFDAVARVVWSD